MRKIALFLLPLLALTLAACSSTGTPSPASPPKPDASPQPTQALEQSVSDDLARTDSQGAVTVVVKPLDLDGSSETLTFEIVMDTHSVDLSFDLASLATLTTDTGLVVQAALWDAPRGGHHVKGTLSFPASVDGKPLLDEAAKLTLTLVNVDAPERIFTWDVPK